VAWFAPKKLPTELPIRFRRGYTRLIQFFRLQSAFLIGETPRINDDPNLNLCENNLIFCEKNLSFCETQRPAMPEAGALS
jgi:hypothetical protein